MNWRNFLAGLALALVLPTMSSAAERLSIGIFPGTGTAEMLRSDFTPMATPFVNELARALDRKPQLTMYRSLGAVNRSMLKGRKDLYLAPPTVAVAALAKGYTPIARVEDFIDVMLVRRKGTTVTTVALTEKQSVPEVLSRLVLRQKDEKVSFMNLRTQDDVLLALERDYAQAGALGGKKARALLESSDAYEEWYALPRSPGFTLVASNQLSEDDRARLERAIVDMDPEVIARMQPAFVAKLGSFVPDKEAEFKTLMQAMSEAGYIR